MPTSVVAAMQAFAAVQRPPVDISRRQRDIQLAVGSNQRGKAGEAAMHIQTCLMAERRAEYERQRMAKTADQYWILAPAIRVERARHDELLASCQAVDAASRAQLVPLLRRSLAEGDKSAAAGLVQALGKNFNLADEPAVLPALRRDAWDCDSSSQRVLISLAYREPQLLTANEIGALREQERIRLGQGLEAVLRHPGGDPQRRAALEGMLATFKPPPEAIPAEMARISADIQSRCKSGPAQAGGLRPVMPG